MGLSRCLCNLFSKYSHLTPYSTQAVQQLGVGHITPVRVGPSVPGQSVTNVSRSIFLRSQTSELTLPTRELPAKRMDLIEGIPLKAVGKSPLSSLFSIFNSFNEVRSPNEAGISPEIVLPERESDAVMSKKDLKKTC